MIQTNISYTHDLHLSSHYVVSTAIWVISVLVDLPQYFGWSYHRYDEKLHFCAFGFHDTLSYTLTTAILGVVLPCNLVIMCYLRIFKHVRQSKLRVSAEGKINQSVNQFIDNTALFYKMQLVNYLS